MNKIVRGIILAACICTVVSMNAFSQEEDKAKAAAPEVAVVATTEAVAPEAATVETPKPVVEDEFMIIDVNVDGSVSVEEYTAFLTTRNEENAAKGAAKSTEDEIKSIVSGRYEKMDINKDGIVTRDEYAAFWVK